jgi:hypothetical protein
MGNLMFASIATKPGFERKLADRLTRTMHTANFSANWRAAILFDGRTASACCPIANSPNGTKRGGRYGAKVMVMTLAPQ